MKVTVQLFAIAKQLARRERIELELAETADIAAVRHELVTAVPDLRPLIGNMLFAVNAEFARDETPITPECNIACIPPVSGG